MTYIIYHQKLGENQIKRGLSEAKIRFRQNFFLLYVQRYADVSLPVAYYCFSIFVFINFVGTFSVFGVQHAIVNL